MTLTDDLYGITNLPRFKCLLLDPPWVEKGGSGRGTGNHYDTLAVRDMPRVILKSDAWNPDDTAIVLMWTTMKSLPDAMWLLGTLGATYKSIGVWEKPYIGMGQYWRAKCEFLLLGTIGQGALSMCKEYREEMGVSASISNVISEGEFRLTPLGHSEKPDESFELIEKLFPGPRVELFSRRERPGWFRWGLEAPKGKERIV